MSRILSVLYRKLVIETRSEVLILCVTLYIMYRGYRTLFGDMALTLLLPTLLIGAFIFDRLRSRNSN
jgi:hypothetical protein